MTHRMHEIRKCIASNDIDVLKQSLEFVKERSSLEANRGQAAETRATALLAVLGIVAGLIVPLAETIGKGEGNNHLFLYLVFGASLLFLVKGIFYGMKILGGTTQYRLKPDTIYDFQPMSPADALREEIVSTIWEHEQAVQPNTKKLFWLNRCQRNGAIAILLLIVFGAAFVFTFETLMVVPSWTAYSLFTLAVLLWLFGDKVAERFGIWGGK